MCVCVLICGHTCVKARSPYHTGCTLELLLHLLRQCFSRTDWPDWVVCPLQGAACFHFPDIHCSLVFQHLTSYDYVAELRSSRLCQLSHLLCPSCTSGEDHSRSQSELGFLMGTHISRECDLPKLHQRKPLNNRLVAPSQSPHYPQQFATHRTLEGAIPALLNLIWDI